LGQDIFARKCMYEKLTEFAAKTGFEIQSYVPRTHEMKNRIAYCQKIKGSCSSFFQKYINCSNITRCLPENPFSSEFGEQLPQSPMPSLICTYYV